MANSFSAEILISTTKAHKELGQLKGTVDDLDKSLANLGKTLKSNQADLDGAVKSISALVSASRDASKASEESARAKLAEAKASAELAKAENSAEIARARVEREKSATALNQATTAYRSARTEATEFANVQRAVSSSTDKLGNSLANQRYLLYDVGDTYRTLALGATALPAAAIAAATAYEKSFAQVIRVSGATGKEATKLREDLKSLATEIPMSFSELANIAQIGGQMNIATEGLAGFTQTVAKFVATADGATIDSSTQAFGRLVNLFGSDLSGEEQAQFFESLGSSIAYVADTSVTSEGKIIAMLQKIAPLGAQAGLTADQVVGLGAALSSVGLAPEISRGFLSRFFANLNKDVAKGGDALDAYNKILGTTSDQFLDLYKNDPAQLLQNLIKSMSEMDKVQQTLALSSIGITGSQSPAVVQALAGSYDVLADAMQNSSEAFASADYLDKSSEGIFNTLSANLEKFWSSLTNLGDTVGSTVIPRLSDFVGILTSMAVGFNDLLKSSPALQTFVSVLASISGVVGVVLGVRSAIAFVQAGFVTMTHVMKQNQTGALGLKNTLRQYVAQMLIAKGVSEAEAQSYVKKGGIMRALQASYASTSATAGIASTTIAAADSRMGKFGRGIKGAGSLLLGMAGGPVGIAITALTALGASWLKSAGDAKRSAQDIADAFKTSGQAGADALAESFARDEVSLASPGTNKFFDNNIGTTFLDVANKIGIGMDTIASKVGGGREALNQYIETLEQMKNSAPSNLGNEYDILIGKLRQISNEMETNEKVTQSTKDAQDGLKSAGIDLGEANEYLSDTYDENTEKVENYAQALNDAIESAFGLTNAQAGVNNALEQLGAGLQKEGSIGTGSEGARANLADYQQALAMQATYLQQQIEAGKITAQQASQTYSEFAQGLLAQLSSMGVDTNEILNDTSNAIAQVNNIFSGMSADPITIPVQADTNSAVMSTDAILSWMNEYLSSNPQLAQIDLSGDDMVGQKVYNLISYISEATGMPFDAVINAITDPAGQNTENVVKYMLQAVGNDFTAYINADTSAAVSNVQNFAVYANNQMAQIQAMLGASAMLPGAVGGAVSAMAGQIYSAKILAAPAQTIMRANKSAVPSFKPLIQGYNDAAKAGQKAGGAGRKAGNDTAKGAKGAGKALQDQKKDWDALEQQVSGYASRVGTAFGYVTARNTGVYEAKDEYYSILNGIKKRLEEQKQQVIDLRAENKKLNAERRVQINDAEKLERMSQYASMMGDSNRAKAYADEAKSLRASADETEAKVKANTKEANEIERGIGKLTGYTQAAIDNRKELRQLRDASLAVSEAYADAGFSAKTVATKTKEWTDKAKAHGKQLGYTNGDVKKVVGTTRDYVTILGRIPKTVSTSLNAKNNASGPIGSVKKALGGLPASKSIKINAAGSGISGVNSQLNNAARNRTSIITTRLAQSAATRVRYKALAALAIAQGNPSLAVLYSNVANKFNKGGLVGRFASGGLIPGTPPSNPREDNIMASIDGQGLAAIRSGEYIQSQPAVDYYGTDIMDKINRMEIPRYALGGQLGNSRTDRANAVSVIELGAESIQNLARAVQKEVNLYVDSQLLARSVDKGMTLIAQQGGRL